jgi:DNA-binding transcriptional LysR family regulator
VTRDLNDLYYFTAVVQHKGFAAASREMGVPKSSLSQRVKRLEDRLGVRLLERTSRSFNVTDIGQDFYQRCSGFLNDVEVAEEAAVQFQGQPRGRVRVSCLPGLTNRIMAVKLPLFLQQNPDVKVELEVTTRDVDLIKDKIDVALRVKPMLSGEASFHARTLGFSKIVLVASAEFLEQHGAPASPAELSGFPTLSYYESGGRHLWVLQNAAGEQAMVYHEPRLACVDFDVVLQAALSGCGIALLPGHVCGVALREGKLRRVLPAWDLGKRVVHLTFTSQRGLLPPVRAFINFLVKELPSTLKFPDLDSPPQRKGGRSRRA